MLNKRIKNQLATILVASLAAFAGVTASAQSKDALYVAGVSTTCATCHGTRGRATDGSSVVSLAGMPAANIILQNGLSGAVGYVSELPEPCLFFECSC